MTSSIDLQGHDSRTPKQSARLETTCLTDRLDESSAHCWTPLPDPKLSDRHAADRLSIPHTKLKTISQPNPSGSEIRHNTSSTLTMYMLNGAVGRVRVICQLLEAYRKHLRVLFTHERLFTPAKLRD